MEQVEMERPSKANRLAKKIQATLAGKASGQLTVKATLTGPAAEAWSALRAEAMELNMDDQAILAALLDAGAATLRKAIRSIPR